jgi:cation:H+ antiporter
VNAAAPGDGKPHSWYRSLVVAAACASLGVVVHYLGALLPVQLEAVGLGIGLVGAAFMLAWAADAGEVVFSGGLVLAVVSLVTVLPEFIIEIRFAFIQAAELVTANLTGATRLLLAGAAALPLVLALRALARREDAAPVQLDENRRLELGLLLVASVFAIQFTVRGNLSVLDSVVLVVLYVVYARRVRGTVGEEPAVVGVAARLVDLPHRQRRLMILGLIVAAGTVVLLVANPFADALLATGTTFGVDPYLLIQSVVPVATESPEFVVAAVLIANRRPAQAIALLLAASVTQWTLGLACLPVAYLAGGGGPLLPLAPREQLELSFTIAMTLFVVAALATLRPERVDAVLVTLVFVAQLAHPEAVVRVAATFVLLVFAVDLMVSRRRYVRPMLRAAWGRRSSASSS